MTIFIVIVKLNNKYALSNKYIFITEKSVPKLVQRKFVFLTILGLGIYQSKTAVGFRTQLGIYLKQNGLHQRAIDVLGRLGITTGSDAIGVEMKRMEQAAKVSTTYIFLLIRAYNCRTGLRHLLEVDN